MIQNNITFTTGDLLIVEIDFDSTDSKGTTALFYSDGWLYEVAYTNPIEYVSPLVKIEQATIIENTNFSKEPF